MLHFYIQYSVFSIEVVRKLQCTVTWSNTWPVRAAAELQVLWTRCCSKSQCSVLSGHSVFCMYRTQSAVTVSTVTAETVSRDTEDKPGPFLRINLVDY